MQKLSRSRKLADTHIPRKRFGQNFLTDRNILAKIVRAAEINPSDTVLEIGPGLGHLTRALAETNARIVAVELDRDLAKNLFAEFSNASNVQILQGDILAQPPNQWLGAAGFVESPHEPEKLVAPTAYLIVANIPYYITSAILRYLLETETPPARIVVMVQREVAEQIIAKPPRANLLGVSVQYFGAPRIIDIVPAGAFYPRPKVDSAIVRIDVTTPRDKSQAAHFFQIVRAGFSAKRKQLHNALTRGLRLNAAQVGELLLRAQIDPTRRAETLALSEWETLARVAARMLPR